MNSLMQKLTFTTLGAAVLVLGSSVSPAGAFTFQFNLSGTTGSLPPCDPNQQYYPEYQDAYFKGSFTVDDTDLAPGDNDLGKFKVVDFLVEVFNASDPGFHAKFTPKLNTQAFIFLDDTDISFLDFSVDNHSTNDPRLGSLFLRFSGKVADPNTLLTQFPNNNFSASASYLELGDAQVGDAPTVKIPVTGASVEAVPEPTTLGGLGLFGLGLVLKRKFKK